MGRAGVVHSYVEGTRRWMLELLMHNIRLVGYVQTVVYNLVSVYKLMFKDGYDEEKLLQWRAKADEIVERNSLRLDILDASFNFSEELWLSDHPEWRGTRARLCVKPRKVANYHMFFIYLDRDFANCTEVASGDGIHNEIVPINIFEVCYFTQ